jgi:hypothetical protein
MRTFARRTTDGAGADRSGAQGRVHEEDSRAGGARGTASSTGHQFRPIPVHPPAAPHRAVHRLVGAPGAVLRVPARLARAGVRGVR